MRKTIRSDATPAGTLRDTRWIDVEKLAAVELTSEADGFPIESVFQPSNGEGWRAAEAGEQTVCLLFDTPQRIRKVRLVFRERQQSRTQEFLLRWSADNGRTFREIARQQYNFAPPDTSCEVEEYAVDLQGLTTLELVIRPDISGGPAVASLAELHLAE